MRIRLQHVDRDELLGVQLQLDQAIHHHQKWHKNLIRTLICHLPCDRHDVLADAHHECRFGQWYDGKHHHELDKHPVFKSIGDVHKTMHERAAIILNSSAATGLVLTNDYDQFANSLERLSLEIGELKSEVDALLYNYDPLTMTINRTTMIPVLRDEQDISKKSSQICCVIMMDLDKFKQINDEYGHAAGDKVLSAVGRFLTEHLRPYDKIFRYGGEEFLICMQQVTTKQAFGMIDRLRREISEFPIDIGMSEPIYITASFGISELETDKAVELSIDHADRALYKSKNNGRNRAEIWTDVII